MFIGGGNGGQGIGSEMSKDSNIDKNSLSALVEQFKSASVATAADRATKDRLLDELQDAVGLSGKMVTESDIIRRAEKLLQ
jgi:hypothetical protein